jgi:hypothetical protein
LERRSLVLFLPLDRNDRLPASISTTVQVPISFGLGNEVRGAWHRRNRLIGDDGARPDVGWVPLAMDEPPTPLEW